MSPVLGTLFEKHITACAKDEPLTGHFPRKEVPLTGRTPVCSSFFKLFFNTPGVFDFCYAGMAVKYS